MSDRHDDDEILGRALSRAIETQDVEETPFERARLAVRPPRRGLPVWQMLGAAAVLVLAVAFGAWFTRPNETLPVAASQTPIASNTPQATQPSAPTATPMPRQNAVDHERVYVIRNSDGVPLGVHVDSIATADTATERVASRVRALLAGRPTSMPADANYVAPSAKDAELGSVTATGDVVTLNFKTAKGTFNLASEVAEWMFAKELVYTATEEPGIHRVTVAIDGSPWAALSSGSALTWPVRREEVFGYATSGPVGKDKGITYAGTGDPAGTRVRFTTMAIGGSSSPLEPSITRFTFEAIGSDGKPSALPPLEMWMQASDEAGTLGGKYGLTVNVPYDTTGSTGGAAHVEFVNQSPVVAVVDAGRSTTITLDDARPWRAYTLDASHFVLEIGGDPRLVGDSIAVWTPAAGAQTQRTFEITGAARVFEATVLYRVQDDAAKTIAEGYTTASIGTSPIWGTFKVTVTIPSTVTGGLHVSVFWVSPKDGTEVGKVTFPLTVR